MKKNFNKIAFAVMLCGTPLAAHAQSSGVMLYGVLDASVQYARSGGQSTTRLDSSNAFPSNWGIQGAEDLGGGMKAIFRLESGINVANGQTAQAGKFFGREAWVGLAGPYGRIQAGLNNTPEMLGFLRFLAGDLGHYDWGHAANNYFFFPMTKVPNSILYESPNLNGFTFSGMWSFGANGDPTMPRTLGNLFSAGVFYNKGPVAFQIDYLQQVYAKSTTILSSTPTATGNHTMLAASYDFGPIKVDGIFVLHRGAGDVVAASVPAYASPNNYYYEVSAQVPRVLGGTVMMSFGQYHQQNNSDANSTSYGLRYDYRLSKTTGVYTGLSYVKNGSLASFSTSSGQGPGIPVEPGHNQIATVVGMVHAF